MNETEADLHREALLMITEDIEVIDDMRQRYTAVLSALKYDTDVEYYMLITENVIHSLKQIKINLDNLIMAYEISHQQNTKEQKPRGRPN